MNLKDESWYRLTRPHTLTAAVMPVLIGTAMGFADGTVDVALFAAMLIASVLIQSAVNMFNEYFDFKRGLDTAESVGIGGVIVNKEMEERTVLLTAVAFFSVSVLLGVYVCARTTWWIAVVGSASMFIGYLYSAGPRPLAYTSFGELAAGIFMGPVIVLISYFVQTRRMTLDAVLISVPISILVAAILMANNIRDALPDSQKGRRTLAVLWGKTRATSFLGWMFACAMLWTIGLVMYRLLSPWTLIVLLSLPKAVQSVRSFKKGNTPGEMLPAMKAASVLHSQFGLLLTLGIVLGKYLPVH